MDDALENAIKSSGRTPDIVFSAHVNNYQRIMRTLGGRQIPFIVAGAVGYFNLRPMAAGLKLPTLGADSGVILQSYDDTHHGFMRVTITKTTLTGEYFDVEAAGGSGRESAQPEDSFILDLQAHRVTTKQLVPP
jgi:acid phosphatase type 7